MILPLFIGLVIAIAILIRVAMWWWRRAPRLNLSESRRVWNEWRRIERLSDPYRQIMEADALVGNVLIQLGFGETFGEALKQRARDIPHLDRVWQAHKLRNRLAHEPGTAVGTAEAKSSLEAFAPVLRTYCRQ